MNNEDIMYALSLPSIKNILKLIPNINQNMILEMPDIDQGSLQITFDKNGKEHIIYVLLKECKKEHNLTEQMDKLMPYLNNEQQNKILQHMSALVLFIRTIYKSIVQNLNIDNIYKELLIDTSNTTMFLPNIESRIGIFLEE